MPSSQVKQNFYLTLRCETGQDQEALCLFVAVVITEDDRDVLRSRLEQIEQKSGKDRSSGLRRARRAYIRTVLADFRNTIN